MLSGVKRMLQPSTDLSSLNKEKEESEEGKK
jgi:hypothetical protein